MKKKIESASSIQALPMEACLEISPSVVYRIQGNICSILDLRTSKCWVLDEVGTYVWLHFDGSNTLDKMISKVAKDTKVNGTVNVQAFQQQVRELASELFSLGLVKAREKAKKTKESKDVLGPIKAPNLRGKKIEVQLPKEHVSDEIYVAAGSGGGTGGGGTVSCVGSSS